MVSGTRTGLLLLLLLLYFASENRIAAQNLIAENAGEVGRTFSADSATVVEKLNRADVLVQEREYYSAVQQARATLQYSLQAGYDVGYLKGLIWLGDHYLTREMPDSAAVAIEEGLGQSQSDVWRLQFESRQGVIKRLEGRPLEAIQIFETALIRADSLQVLEPVPNIRRGLSQAYQMIGEFGAAFEQLYRGLQAATELENPIYMAGIHYDLGEMLVELENPEEALYYLGEAEQIYRYLEQSESLVPVLSSLGKAYMGMDRLGEAGDSFNEAIRLAEEVDNLILNIRTLNHLGEYYVASGEVETARDYFYRALELSEEHRFSEGLYYGSAGMGDLHYSQGAFLDSRQWYRSALDEAEQMGDQELVGRALEMIYLSYKEAGLSGLALESLERYHDHLEQHRSLQQERARAEFETMLETRRQEEENRLLMARQAEQEARIQLQQTAGIAILIVLAVLLITSFFLYRTIRQKETLNLELADRNRQISEKNRQLDHLNHTQKKLFAVVSHDLRGPLSSLKGLLQLLRIKDPKELELDKLTSNLEKNLSDNTASIENLLTWASSQMGGMEVKPEPLKLRQELESIHSQFNHQLAEKKIDLEVDVDSGLEVSADREIVSIIIRNLISNAIKFSSEGDSIQIQAEKNSRSVVIHVQDQGVGIEMDDQGKIFGEEYFTRKGTGNEKGSGLGLLLCKEFVEKHGGEIWFESRPGRGTTFSFSIPDN